MSLRKLLTHEFPLILTLGLLVVQVLTYFYVTNRPNTIAPEGHEYTVLGKNFYYPSMIYQAKDGAWGIIDTHTTRPTPMVFVEVFFVFLGKIAALFNISAVHMYLIAQVVGGILVFAVSYWLITLLVPKGAQLYALLFVLALETGPLLTTLSAPVLSWEPSFPSHVLFDRHFGLPHHTWGEALGMLYIITLFLTVRRPTPLRVIALIFLALIATTVLPPYMVTFGLTAMAIWGVYSLFTRSLGKIFPPFLLSALAVGAAGLLVKLEFAKGVPWDSWQAAEKSWWTHERLLTQYGSTLVLFYPFILLAAVFALLKWKSWTAQLRITFLTMLAWVFGPFVLVPFSHYEWFPVANFRMTDGYQYLPAGILAGIGVWQLTQLFSGTKLRRTVATILCGTVMAVSLCFSYIFIRQILGAQQNFWSNVYPQETTMDGVRFVDTLPKGSGIMVREYFGEIIPGFANVRVFIGGPHGFPDWGERQWIANRFFTGEYSEADARQVLTDNDIAYVFYGPDEQALTTTSEFYPSLLVPVYNNPTVTVFKVIK